MDAVQLHGSATTLIGRCYISSACHLRQSQSNLKKDGCADLIMDATWTQPTRVSSWNCLCSTLQANLLLPNAIIKYGLQLRPWNRRRLLPYCCVLNKDGHSLILITVTSVQYSVFCSACAWPSLKIEFVLEVTRAYGGVEVRFRLDRYIY